MKLVVTVKLLPTKEQYGSLLKTLEASNRACNFISKRAWQTKTFKQFDIHRLTYHDVRGGFHLGASVTVRCIAKVAAAYKLSRNKLVKFQSRSTIAHDHGSITFRRGNKISIWTIDGRIKLPYAIGAQYRQALQFRKGEIDLIFKRKHWLLGCVIDIDQPDKIIPRDVIGVDFGIVNIATSSTGRCFSGKSVDRARCTFSHRRRNLQRKGTRAAIRKLRSISGRQARHQKDLNHCIAKTVVADAKGTRSAIALEDLGSIRSRVTARRHQRARLSNWGFRQLRRFIEYKAAMAGVPVFLVDPRNTSRQCPDCGRIAKANRKSRDIFKCIDCGLAGPADAIAALNIRARALANAPMVASVDSQLQVVA